jgi:long-chain acyl-CoA synthetase
MATLNVAMMLEDAAHRVPDKVYLMAGEQRFTYSQVDAEARRFANVLAGLGVERGGRVALMLPTSPIFATCYYGAFKLGAVPLIINVTSPGPEVAYFLTNSGASALIALEPYVEEAIAGFEEAGTCWHLIVANLPGSDACPEPAQRLDELMAAADTDSETALTRPEDPALILYTAGTTGRPKGAFHTHFSWYQYAHFIATSVFRLRPGDVVMHQAPPAHAIGQVLFLSPCAVQAAVTLLPRFEMETFLRTIEQHKVTHILAVPTLVHYMLHSPLVDNYDLSSLRGVLVGGAPVHPEMAQAFQERFQVGFSTAYGSSESGPLTFLDPDMWLDAPFGSCGLPSFGTTLRIVDEAGHDVPVGEDGEIVARGPSICDSYYNNPEETTAAWRAGWHHTGDVGRMDEQGYLFVVDRVKDMIKRSGYAVSPAEIERVLHTHPAVAEASVVGVPDEALGEEIKAVVVLKPEANASAEELINYCKGQLAAYKYPRLIEFRDSLPKSPAGKILRRALRE